MQQIEAIYENGVLRPLSPLPLEENQRVRVFVTAIFNQKADPWKNVKDRVEETAKKLGVLPEQSEEEAEPAATA